MAGEVMNLPECAKCDSSRRDLCKALFEGYADIAQEGVEMLDEAGTLDALPLESMDMMQRSADNAALQALGFLAHWDCELTLEQVEQRLLLTRATQKD